MDGRKEGRDRERRRRACRSTYFPMVLVVAEWPGYTPGNTRPPPDKDEDGNVTATPS